MKITNLITFGAASTDRLIVLRDCFNHTNVNLYWYGSLMRKNSSFGYQTIQCAVDSGFKSNYLIECRKEMHKLCLRIKSQ